MNKVASVVVACFILLMQLAYSDECFLLVNASNGNIVMKRGEERLLEEPN